MPVDALILRRVADHNDQVTEGIKAASKQLEKLDPRLCENTSTAAKDWVHKVRELKVSLDAQQGLSKEMRKSARIQEERHGDSFRDKYRFLVGLLKADIRGFFSELPDFVDLPQDFTNQTTWDHCTLDMETDIKQLSAINGGDSGLTNVEPIVMLLNYRDRVISLLLAGMLFQIAVLHWDLKTERAYADGPLVQMAEQVVHIFSKTESLPHKFRLSPAEGLPAAMEPGPFTYIVPGERAPDAAAKPPATQYRLLTVLRELQTLGTVLNNLKASQQVPIPQAGKSSAEADTQKEGGERVVQPLLEATLHVPITQAGKSSTQDLQKEMTKWFERCVRLEKEMSSKREKQQQSVLEVEVEQLTAKCAEKEQLNKQQITRVHKLESDVQSMKYELANLRRERSELVEKNARMAKDNLPVVDKLLGKSREAVERLSKDCETLSKMFRLQSQVNKSIQQEQTDISNELSRTRGRLAEEREKIRLKEGELERKETLYLRTMAARKCIHEAALEQRAKIAEAEEKMRQREDDWQEMLKVLEGRDSEISQMQGDLRRAMRRIEELNQQKLMCMEAFNKATGLPGTNLLKNFKPKEPLPPSEGGL